MRKVYDCFPFFNELDLLELRLEEAYSHGVTTDLNYILT
jgi:hypothetical protein